MQLKPVSFTVPETPTITSDRRVPHPEVEGHVGLPLLK